MRRQSQHVPPNKMRQHVHQSFITKNTILYSWSKWGYYLSLDNVTFLGHSPELHVRPHLITADNSLENKMQILSALLFYSTECTFSLMIIVHCTIYYGPVWEGFGSSKNSSGSGSSDGAAFLVELEPFQKMFGKTASFVRLMCKPREATISWLHLVCVSR